MQKYDVDTFFGHYGIKGMRWGIRKKGKTTSQVASSLTDRELNKRVKRLNMEKQYVDLVSGKAERDKSSVQRGREAINKTMLDIGGSIVKGQLKNLGNQVASDMLDTVGVAAAAAIEDAKKNR